MYTETRTTSGDHSLSRNWDRAYTVDRFKANWGSKYPLAGNREIEEDKYGVAFRGQAIHLHRMTREKALCREYLQINNRVFTESIFLDLDYEWSEEALIESGLPRPHIVTVSNITGHSHIGYYLNNPILVNDGGSYAAISFLKIVVDMMVAATRADRAYSNRTTQNPAHHNWIAGWLDIEPYSLNQLKEGFYPEAKRVGWTPNRPITLEMEEGDPQSRNLYLFNMLRLDALKTHDSFRDEKGKLSRSAMETHLEDLGTANNGKWPQEIIDAPGGKGNLPLSDVEVRGIARSIARYMVTEFDPGRFSRKQARRGRQGGLARKYDHDKIVEMDLTGSSTTEIMEALNCTRRTVERVLSEGSSKKRHNDKMKSIAAEMLSDGVRPADVVETLGISLSQVYRIKKALKPGEIDSKQEQKSSPEPSDERKDDMKEPQPYIKDGLHPHDTLYLKVTGKDTFFYEGPGRRSIIKAAEKFNKWSNDPTSLSFFSAFDELTDNEIGAEFADGMPRRRDHGAVAASEFIMEFDPVNMRHGFPSESTVPNEISVAEEFVNEMSARWDNLNDLHAEDPLENPALFGFG